MCRQRDLKQVSLITAILLSSIHVSASEFGGVVPCTLKDLFGRNERQFGSSDRFISLNDGTQLINPFYQVASVGSVLPNNARSPVNHAPEPELALRSIEQILAVAEKARRILLEEVSGGKLAASFTEEQQLMINRLRAVKVKVVPCAIQRMAPAAHVLTGDTIEVCKQAATATPELALLALFAHEFGHSLDPCTLANSAYENPNPRVVLAPAFEYFYRQSFEGMPVDEGELHDRLLDLKKPGIARILIARGHQAPHTKAAFGKMLASGRLKRIDSGIGVGLQVTAPVLACLHGKNGYPAAPTSLATACDGSEFSEVGAQIWGARVVAKSLEKSGPLPAMQMLGLFAHSQFNMSQKANQFTQKSRDFEAIYLSEPGVQRAFRCEPTEQQICMKQFNTSGTKSLDGATPKATKASGPSVR
jgi:hypothetical protein